MCYSRSSLLIILGKSYYYRKEFRDPPLLIAGVAHLVAMRSKNLIENINQSNPYKKDETGLGFCSWQALDLEFCSWQYIYCQLHIQDTLDFEYVVGNICI